jgi:outer membrane protein OmpA-like peptidoglycan-associated protein
MKSSSAMSLLNFAAPLVLAFLGKRARKDNLNAASLANLLRNERDSIEAAVPGPLAHFEPERERVVERERQPSMPPPMERMTYATQAPAKRSPLRWLLPLAAAIVAIALLVNLLGRDRAGPAQTTQTVTAPTTAPTGTVFFESDQATLPANGQAALAPVVSYLQQNPNATAVVSGYHDPTGDPAMNEQLAQSRAEAVRSSLIAAGIPDSRIEMQRPGTTQGGGTPEQARRVEVTIR